MLEEKICPCGEKFTLTDKERAYFSRKIIDKETGREIQLKAPSHCGACIEKRNAKK